MAFALNLYPWIYVAHFDGQSWSEEYIEQPHLTPQEEAALSAEERHRLMTQRNAIPSLPLVNYTTQYGLGCFEGLKAMPQKDGSLKVFRPDRNADRMYRSMEGLMMPPFPRDTFVRAVCELTRRNAELGFRPAYDPAWEAENYRDGHAIYIRPFTYSEPAIGLGISRNPWVVIIETPVSSYFTYPNTKAITTHRFRATPGGTGWIKCNANYVSAILAKKEAEAQGYMEAVFLDAKTGTFVEEGSSCNIFFYLKNGKLVTPDLGDTILPGITRASIIQLARDMGLEVEERRISIEEAMSESVEIFVTGTAAGVSPIESLTHRGVTRELPYRDKGKVSLELQATLKGIQYGALPDTYGWLYAV